MKIVLVKPEIPQNTGSIGRTCVALNLELILIKPYGFSLRDKVVSRSGTRYWKDVNLSEYHDWEIFLQCRKPKRNQLYFFEENRGDNFYSPTYDPDCFLVFGCESTGLPLHILKEMEDRTFHIPMRNSAVKSLNLANAATAAIYQALKANFISSAQV